MALSNGTVTRAAGPTGSITLPHTRSLVLTTTTVLALSAGVAAALVSGALSWAPSYWGDEAASILSAQRPLATLFPMLARVDAVHGLYYLFLHFWIQVFGISEFATRAPSAIAVGVAVAGIVVLTNRLAETRSAIFAALTAAILPRFTYMGAEARSYALATAVAVWLTVLLVEILRRRTGRILPWVAYCVLLAAGIYLFLYLLLLVVVHGTYLAATARNRAVWRRWGIASVGGILLAAPLIAYAIAERHQISFLAKRPVVTPNTLLVTQWFGNIGLAVVAWALILVAIGLGLRRGTKFRPLTVLAVSWLLLPPIILLAVNYLVAPSYTVRYLSFATPAAAILIGLAVSAIPFRSLRVVAAFALVALAIPSYLAERGDYAKDGGSDWREVSSWIGTHANAGDGIVFDASTAPRQRPRLAMHLYPADYAGLDDVTLDRSYVDTTGLWDTTIPLSAAAPTLSALHTVWVVDVAGSPSATSPDQAATLGANGYHLVRTTHFHRSIVSEYTR